MSTRVSSDNRRPKAPETLLRQWTMLRLLPVEPRNKTVAVLKMELEAQGFVISERTLQRDLNKLSAVFGIAKGDAVDSPGWYLLKTARDSLRLPILNVYEMMAFLLLKEYPSHLLPAFVFDNLNPFFELAERDARAMGRNTLVDWPGKVAVVPASQPLLPPAIDPEVQRNVSNALLGGRMLRLMYQNREQTAPEARVVHPLALVTRGTMVYLVAAAENHENIRLRALHRIDHAEVLDDPVRVPEGFRLDRFIAEGQLGFGQGKITQLKALFTNQAAQHLFDTPLTTDQQIVVHDPDWKLVTATLPETQQLTWWLLGFGDKVEVLEPEPLRQELADIAANMARNYAQAP